MPDEAAATPIFRETELVCPHCGNPTYVNWKDHPISAVTPDRSTEHTVGRLYSTTCANPPCKEPILAWRKTVATEKEKEPKEQDAFLVLSESGFVTVLVEITAKFMKQERPDMSDEETARLRNALAELWRAFWRQMQAHAADRVLNALPNAMNTVKDLLLPPTT